MRLRVLAGWRRLLAAVLALMVVTTLASCGTPPWKTAAEPAKSSASGKAVSATPTPTKTAAAPTKTATAPAQNDLSTGSAKRSIEAGGVRIKINYWSTLDMADWTATAGKPLNLSASAKFIDGSEQNIFLSRVTVNVEVTGAKGPLAGPAPLVDASSVTPGYLIKSPSSYGQVFTIPTLASGATGITLTITYELLVQSAPKAKTFSKQTGSNDLMIPIAA